MVEIVNKLPQLKAELGIVQPRLGYRRLRRYGAQFFVVAIASCRRPAGAKSASSSLKKSTEALRYGFSSSID